MKMAALGFLSTVPFFHRDSADGRDRKEGKGRRGGEAASQEEVRLPGKVQDYPTPAWLATWLRLARWLRSRVSPLGGTRFGVSFCKEWSCRMRKER